MSGKVPYRSFSGTSASPIISASKSRPVVVLFTAEWLGSAHILETFLSELTPEFPRVQIFKVDVDKNSTLPEQFSVSRVPTTVFISKGEIKYYLAGIISKRKLRDKLTRLCK